MSSLSRWQVKLGLLLFWGVTVLTPLVIGPTSLSYRSSSGWELEIMYLFLFGAYFPSGGVNSSGWFTGLMFVPYFIMFLLFFLIYALQVTYYCFKPTTQRWAIISGLLSLIIPLATVGISVPFGAYIGGVYAGPLPFQFILGLVVMRIVKTGIEKPEDGLVEEKTSWWEKYLDDSLSNKQ